MYPDHIILEEQGPRDGFQIELKPVPTELKVTVIERLVKAGLTRIQIASFVNPKVVPQMADAEAVCAQVKRQAGVVYSALVLNAKGVARAVESELSHVAISLSASDTHSRRNTQKSLPQARDEFADMVRTAKAAGLTVRGGIQSAFGCRYEGKINEDLVVELAEEHLSRGIDELALADSTGMGNPASMRRILSRVVPMAGPRPVILHLHDTEGKGMANLLTAIDCGVRIFDTAIAGLGGCPFIRGATGNIATEDTALMLHQMGIQTGIDVDALVAVARDMDNFFGRTLPGKVKGVTELVV
jgi:hydroxymethylglutaryl-CoA lyase